MCADFSSIFGGIPDTFDLVNSRCWGRANVARKFRRPPFRHGDYRHPFSHITGTMDRLINDWMDVRLFAISSHSSMHLIRICCR